MSKAEQSFFGADAKERAARSVAAVEARTSAEIVLTVRPISGHYRHVDYLAGLLLAFVTLLLLLFLPQPFTVDSMPVDVLAAFAIGAVGAPTRRRCGGASSPKLLDSSVRTAARAAFVDGGVTRTRGRTGILIFVSISRAPRRGGGQRGDESAAPRRGLRRRGGRDPRNCRRRPGFHRNSSPPSRPSARPSRARCPAGEDDENELSDAMDVAS